MVADILSVQPGELKFSFELRKQASASMRLVNLTSDYVAFKVKTTSPKKYCVRPNTGIVPPQSSAEVTVTMQGQKEAPSDMQSKDKFLIQSVVVSSVGNAAVPKSVTQDMFVKESGREIHETKLRVVYVSPPEPPSPIAEEPEEGPGPFGQEADMAQIRPDPASKDVKELRARLTEAKSALSTVTKEKNKYLQEMQSLRANLKRRPPSSSCSTFFVLLLAIIFLIIGIIIGLTQPQPLDALAHSFFSHWTGHRS
eukprot:TRINITY_DN329_c0_g1_i2.p1 TRINITY_DN329_c0_g1~~TRINITY_DN329_c0_g1_i2.p1  ORF type:complete len:254 (+),score=59.63 TRINITY_DN329_c0_g1_i2:280-1041(+)